MKTSPLANRTMSGFPVSIGTGLALETLFTPIKEVYDESRVFETIPDLSVYDAFIFNTGTLLRNILNSTTADLVSLDKKEIYDTLLEEIEFLTNFFQSNQLNIQFYVHNYAYVKSTYEPKNTLRKSSTTKQMLTDGILTYCLNQLKNEDDVTLFTKDIHYGKEVGGLIFTHVPFDLLSYDKFKKLELLESHTGKVKTRKEWNTKYYPVPGKDMSFLPFMEYLLCEVFGDNIMFKPAPLPKRIEVHEVMRRKGVNPLTSEFSMSFIRN